jgi:hypothetical protein
MLDFGLEIGLPIISHATFGRCKSASSYLPEKIQGMLTRARSAYCEFDAPETISPSINYTLPYQSQIDEASSDLKKVVEIENNSAFEAHPVVNAFIATYRALPIAVRAKVENWHISTDDIMATCKDFDGSGSYHALYHGAEVSVAQHIVQSEQHYLETEIRVLAQLRHPNIVSFLGASICGETWTVVVERMPYGSIRSLYLSKQKTRPCWCPKTDTALAWAMDLVRAITYLHLSNPSVTHRDVRPDTIFLARSGAIKIASFRRCALIPRTPPGSSPPMDAAGPADHPSPRIGSAGIGRSAARPAGYAAPELLRNDECADPAVDIYAAAAVISYLRFGREPDQASPVGCLTPRRPGKRGGWGRRAEAVLAAAAAWDPAERPAADALVDALEDAAALRGRRACRVS